MSNTPRTDDLWGSMHGSAYRMMELSCTIERELAALREQLAETKRENERILDLHKALMKDMSDRYDASEERCRALEADAWRYRWERENPAWETEAYLGGMTPEQYDAAIDHAIMECKYEG